MIHVSIKYGKFYLSINNASSYGHLTATETAVNFLRMLFCRACEPGYHHQHHAALTKQNSLTSSHPLHYSKALAG
jgi:hypothetical protein